MPTSRPKPTHNTLGVILELCSDIEELKDEMEEWLGNIPDSLQSSDKSSQIEEAASTLDQAHGELEEACNGIKRILEEIPVDKLKMLVLGMPIKFLDMPINYTEHKMYKGYQMPRWVRLANPCAALGEAMQFIEDHMEGFHKDLPEDQVEELKQYKEQVDNALSDLENVDFPSMFG